MTDREKILSDDYYDLIVDFNYPSGVSPVEDFAVQPITGEISIIYANRSQVIPMLYGLMPGTQGNSGGFDPTPLIRSGITRVQAQPLNLTGRGVVLGFVDTGIRYEEPVFRREDGSTRILGIWDQTIQTGEPPQGILYGTEYKREQIDLALQSENPREIVPSYDENGHGTEIASVAAGSVLGNGLQFVGAAPDAEIVVVKLRQAKPHLKEFYQVPQGAAAYAESDLLVALKYLESYAISLVRPLVICFGLGTNLGDHEGHSVLADYMNRIATMRSREIIACGGDQGNSAHHYIGSSAEGLTETVDNVEIRVGNNVGGFTGELWGSVSANHAIAIRAPGGEVTPRADFKGQGSQEFRFIFERTRIQVDHVLVEQSSGEELIFFRFLDPTPGIWISGGRVSESTFHVWLPLSDFLQREVYFLRPSPYTTLTEPSNAGDIITVTSYDDRNDSFYAESGRGYTRLGRIKPDICAPGVGVSTILGNRTATGISAAMTAGAAAQFLQWAVVEGNRSFVETRELKNYLIRGARRSNDLSYPNREWGYGALDIAGTFAVLAGV